MTKWQPDTCDCEIEYDNSYALIKVHNKCKLHKNVADADLLNTLLTHNRSFNWKYGHGEKTKEQKEDILNSKAVEKERIRALSE